MSSTVNVTEVMDSGRFGSFQLRIAILCGFLVFLDGFDLQAITFTAKIIATQWGASVSSFGPVFSAGLVGVMIGALGSGPLADIFGRRMVIIVATFIFSVFALATPFAGNVTELMLIRFLTGIGLGGVMPNVIALTSEFAPERVRSTAIAWMFIGFPLGGVVGGFVAPSLIAAFGWKSMFYLGGILPLLMVPVALAILPESIRFLVMRGGANEKIVTLLKRMGLGSFAGDSHFIVTEESLRGFPVRYLFTEGRTVVTALLWLAFFCNLLVIFFLASWLPSVLQQASVSAGAAAALAGTFHLGGVLGSLINGKVMDRYGQFRILGTLYAAATVFIGTIGMSYGSIPILAVAIFCAGWCVIGGQTVANAIAAGQYPTAIRSTGVGWALGIGRIGSIIGPFLGGMLLTAGLGTKELFMVAAAPTIIGSLAIFTLGWWRASKAPMIARAAAE